MLTSGAPQTTHSTAPSTFSECPWAPCSQIVRNPGNRMQHSPQGVSTAETKCVPTAGGTVPSITMPTVTGRETTSDAR